jgi:dihydrofolate reductase
MKKLIVLENLTLDGVMQAPGRPDEDVRGGFQHGGWAIPYNDEVLGQAMGARMASGGPLLLGRRTYEDFTSFWPTQKGNPFTEVLEQATKYVASRTLEAPLPWANSTLLGGNVAEAVATLKKDLGNDLTALGSGELVRTLISEGLVDEFVLLIHPVVLGSGQRLFADEGSSIALRLVESVPTTTGVLIAVYEPSA